MRIKKIIVQFFICFIICYFNDFKIVHASIIQIKLIGLNDTLQNNVQNHLSKININNFYNKLHLSNIIIKTIKAGLRPFGYYEPLIILTKFNQYSLLNKEHIIIHAKIELGKQIYIKGSNIIIDGSAKDNIDFQELIKNSRPINNSSLNHDKYEKFKKNLFVLSQTTGYFDAFFNKHQLQVSIEKCEAFWDIYYNSGVRYSFGDILFSGSQIQNQYLNHLKSFKKNDKYTSYAILELNRKLSLTGWFNTVEIKTKIDRINKVVPIKVIVSPNSKNIIEIGFGYSNDIMFRMKSIWKKPWINSYGHSLISSMNISKIAQQINFVYKIPMLNNPIENYFLLKGKWKSNNHSCMKYRTTTLIISRYWDNNNGWQKSINLNWSLDNFRNKNNVNTMLVYPGININRIKKQDGLITYKGNSQNYSLDFSNMFFLSDLDFVILKAQNTWINSSYSKKHRIILHSNLGWIITPSFHKIPMNLRFFAGGDRSIRGYNYNSIFSNNHVDQIIGGSKLITGSVEYQYNFLNKLWSVIFIDSGDALNYIKQVKFRTGIGIGMRWELPIGPIKFDIAFPIKKTISNHFQFYIGLGPEL